MQSPPFVFARGFARYLGPQAGRQPMYPLLVLALRPAS